MRSKISAFVILLLAFNLMLLMIAIAAFELIFGQWLAPYKTPSAAVVNRSAVFEQQLYDPPGKVVYVRDQFGLRGVREPLALITMVTLGGSTTDQRHITEGATWQDVIRIHTGIAIANAGVDGMSSFGHILAVRDWLHNIDALRPRFVLHLIGINDAPMPQEAKEVDRPGASSSIYESLSRNAAIWKIARDLRAAYFNPGPAIVAHQRILPAPISRENMVKADINHPEAQRFTEVAFRRNLRTLVELHRARSEKMIMVSQSVPPWWGRFEGKEVLVPPGDQLAERYVVALKLVNTMTQRTCEENRDHCNFIDLATNQPFDPTDFYDAIHTTPAGARKIGTFLAQNLPTAVKSRR